MAKIDYKKVILLILFSLYMPLSAFSQAEAAKALAWSIITELVEELNGEDYSQRTIDESLIIIEANLPSSKNFDRTRTIIRNWHLKKSDIRVLQEWWSDDSGDYEFHTLRLYLQGHTVDTMIASLTIDFCDPRRWNCEGVEGMYKIKFTIGDLTL